jgi:hypothetical protein
MHLTIKQLLTSSKSLFFALTKAQAYWWRDEALQYSKALFENSLYNIDKRNKYLGCVNTLHIKALHKALREAYQNSNKVNFVAHIYIWDDQWLFVETWETRLQYMAVEKVRTLSQTNERIYMIHTLTSFALPSPRGLQYWQKQQPLQHVENAIIVVSFETTITSDIWRLKQ